MATRPQASGWTLNEVGALIGVLADFMGQLADAQQTMNDTLVDLGSEVASTTAGMSDLQKGIMAMADQLDALRTQETQLSGAISDLKTRVTTDLAALQAKIDAGVSHDELAQDVAAMQANLAAVQAIDPAPAPAPAPMPEPAPADQPAPPADQGAGPVDSSGAGT